MPGRAQNLKVFFSVLLIGLIAINKHVYAFDIVNGSDENPFPRLMNPASVNPTLGVAEAIGGHAHGCLTGAVAMPHSGEGYYLLRTFRHRFFAHPNMFNYLREFALLAKNNPLLIGDIAQPRGGPTNTLHVSHQSGLDVDIWYQQRKDYADNLAPDWPQKISARSVVDFKTMQLNSEWKTSIEPLIMWSASHENVNRIFVHPVIKRRFCQQHPQFLYLNKIRPWYGHDDHYHVRLNCPANNPDCESQTPVPSDSGCGSELDWWFTPDAEPPPPSKEPIVFTLPERCRAVSLE